MQQIRQKEQQTLLEAAETQKRPVGNKYQIHTFMRGDTAGT